MKNGLVVCVSRLTGWFLLKLLGRLLSSVIVHRGQMQMLQTACKVHYYYYTHTHLTAVCP